MSLKPLLYWRTSTAPQGKHMVLLKNMRDADYHVTQQAPTPPPPTLCVSVPVCM